MICFPPSVGKNNNMPDRGWVKASELCVAAFFPEDAVREAENTFRGVVLPRPWANECLFWPTELRSPSSNRLAPCGVENRTSFHRTVTPSDVRTDTVPVLSEGPGRYQPSSLSWRTYPAAFACPIHLNQTHLRASGCEEFSPDTADKQSALSTAVLHCSLCDAPPPPPPPSRAHGTTVKGILRKHQFINFADRVELL